MFLAGFGRVRYITKSSAITSECAETSGVERLITPESCGRYFSAERLNIRLDAVRSFGTWLAS